MAKPTFGGPLMPSLYYEQVSSIIRVLRPHSSLRVIAAHLTSNGFRSPSGLPWCRMKVFNFIRSPQFKATPNPTN